MKLELFSTDFRKILKYQISLKTVRWEPRFSVRTDAWADGLTDGQSDRHMTKLIVAFINFANASKNHLASQCCRILLSRQPFSLEKFSSLIESKV
jgi:hypothetical protein